MEATEGGFRWVEHKSGIFWFLKDLETIGNNSDALQLDAVSGAEDGNRVISVFQLDSSGEVVHDSSDLPVEIKLMFLLNILISLALGPKSPIAWSMYADAADFNEWKTGRRATAMTFSAATFSQKLGGALGSAGILWVLASLGYAANQIQEGASLTGIVWLQTVVPAFFAFVAIFALKFYDLSGDKLEQIQKDLSERNAQV
jgi:GPH family glycoside/pentoside/hexuronide:cation symporter